MLFNYDVFYSWVEYLMATFERFDVHRFRRVCEDTSEMGSHDPRGICS